jgi:CheY-like chemotaxis protein
VNKQVLYADDDADDRLWISEACEAVGADLTITFVENGREVLQYLKKLQLSALPSLIILDLNMPHLDGKQTLKNLKSDSKFSHIPVAIVSTSSSKMDRDVCTRLGASLFLVKPTSHQRWRQVVEQLVPLAQK